LFFVLCCCLLVEVMYFPPFCHVHVLKLKMQGVVCCFRKIR
jgi:hypothetical protein